MIVFSEQFSWFESKKKFISQFFLSIHWLSLRYFDVWYRLFPEGIVCTTTSCPPPPLLLVGGRVEPPTKVSQRDDVRGLQLWEGVAGKEGGNFFQGEGVAILQKKIKWNLKYLMTKKLYKKNIFFSVITNNSNWEILNKNLVTFKR